MAGPEMADFISDNISTSLLYTYTTIMPTWLFFININKFQIVKIITAKGPQRFVTKIVRAGVKKLSSESAASVRKN